MDSDAPGDRAEEGSGEAGGPFRARQPGAWWPLPGELGADHPGAGPVWTPVSHELSTGTPRPARRRRRLGVVAALALVGAVVAVTVLVVAPHERQTPEQRVMASAKAALVARTAAVTITADVGGGEVHVNGEGSVDFARAAMSLRLSVGGTAAARAMTVNAVYVNGTIYEQIPGLDALKPGKSWVSLDLPAVASGNASGQGGTIAGEADAVAKLQLLTRQGATVTRLGPSVIGGVAVDRYQVHMDGATVQRNLSAMHLPAWMGDALGQVAVRGVSETVSIDRSGRLRRLAADTTVTVAGASVTTSETIDFTSYGMPVSIAPPPAAAVVPLDQLLKDARSGIV